MWAQCQCGQLTVASEAVPTVVVACHCIDCQRRTGSPFGVLAYYPADQVRHAGEASRFERPTASGGTFSSLFCPRCGSTVLVLASRHPGAIGIPVGVMAQPDFPAPARSVWEQSMHHWVEMPGRIQHFKKGRS